MDLQKIKNQILDGRNLCIEDAYELENAPLNELLEAANEVRAKFCGNYFNFCSIINVKSGKCSENCKYCAQSAHFDTKCEIYDILPFEKIMPLAKLNDDAGVARFSLVASGKGLHKKDDLQKVIEIYKKLKSHTKFHLCASFGIVSKEILAELKKSGVKTYHHNLETSRKFFPKICTTHTYDDRINTIKSALCVGLDVCSGGIFGLGESLKDRIDMAYELKNLKVSSVPINILTPIKGTPLENSAPLCVEEILRSIAIFRLILPHVFLRLAGGRNNLKNSVKTALNGGINSAITGDFLTTCGDVAQSDKNLVSECGFVYKKSFDV